MIVASETLRISPFSKHQFYTQYQTADFTDINKIDAMIFFKPSANKNYE
jgi:hypothetical protein